MSQGSSYYNHHCRYQVEFDVRGRRCVVMVLDVITPFPNTVTIHITKDTLISLEGYYDNYFPIHNTKQLGDNECLITVPREFIVNWKPTITQSSGIDPIYLQIEQEKQLEIARQVMSPIQSPKEIEKQLDRSDDFILLLRNRH